MQYSEYEILSSYRDAKLKRKQLGILADMNCCTVAEMRQYLLEHGIPEEELPKKPGRKNKQTAERAACERSVCHGVPVSGSVGATSAIPEIVKVALVHEENRISLSISQLDNELSNKKNTMLEIQQQLEKLNISVEKLSTERATMDTTLQEIRRILNA